MTKFHYKALTPAGEPSEGELEAASEAVAVERLREQGLLPISFRAASASRGGSGGFLVRRRSITHAQLTLFTRELSRLLGAGVSLDRSMTILASVTEEPVQRALLTRLLESVRGGGTFTEALQREGAPFNRLYVNMVRAGEEGGALNLVLDRLADYLEKSREFRANIIAALIYPAILLFVAVASLVILLALVVPQFQQMFDEAGAVLPLPTQVVIALSESVQRSWWVVLLVLLAVLLALPKLMAQPSVRLFRDRLLLSLAGIGPLVQKIEVSRFCRTLATLLGNGVVLLTALGIVRETLGNRVLVDSVDAIVDSLKSGGTFSAPMLEQGVFPKLACHMVRVGEETGQLDRMLLDVADIYDKEVAQSLKKLLSLIEPVMILTLGALVAGIIFSILIALLGINELAL